MATKEEEKFRQFIEKTFLENLTTVMVGDKVVIDLILDMSYEEYEEFIDTLCQPRSFRKKVEWLYDIDFEE